jgi:hypothetical protein
MASNACATFTADTAALAFSTSFRPSAGPPDGPAIALTAGSGGAEAGVKAATTAARGNTVTAQCNLSLQQLCSAALLLYAPVMLQCDAYKDDAQDIQRREDN